MSKAPIDKVELRASYTSRGDPTVEAVVVASGFSGTATAPAGASAGKFEAPHLPPGGVEEAIRNFESSKSRILGVDASDLLAVTRALREIDGTGNYSRIGGAVAFAVSVAALEAASRALGTPMHRLLGSDKVAIPLPLGNVLGGGKHAGPGAPDIQEYLVVPLNPRSPREAVEANFAVHKAVRRELERLDPSFPAGKGDEGAWAPRIKNLEALEVVARAAEKTSAEIGVRIGVGLDVAASTLWSPGEKAYVYRREGKKLTREEQVSWVMELAERYELVYLEDPLEENDFEGFAELTKWARGRRLLVTGDDLFVTNPERLRRGASMGAANAAILKVNQVGSLGDAAGFAAAARGNGYKIIASHRSGDTCDKHLAHIAVGLGAAMMKSGVVGGERVSKLVELIRIGEAAGSYEMASLF